MPPLQLRPHMRAPWQAIAGFAVALYVIRSAMRGWDFRPAVLDFLVFGTLALILAARPLINHLVPDDEPAPADETDEDGDDPTT